MGETAKPLPVEIVRPERTWEACAGEWIARAVELFTTAWVLMLYAPQFAPWHPGYWQAFAVVAIAAVMFPHRPSLDTWSRNRPK